MNIENSLCLLCLFSSLHENAAGPQMSVMPSKPDVTGNVAGAVVKPADDELLMASVPPPSEETPAHQPEQSTPTDSIPLRTPSDSVSPTLLPRPKLSEELPSESRQAAAPATAPRTKSAEEILESKLAPAAVSEAELIKPVKRPYISKNQPLANIMKGSIDTNETKDADSKFARRSVESDVKDAPEVSKALPVVQRGTFWMIY